MITFLLLTLLLPAFNCSAAITESTPSSEVSETVSDESKSQTGTLSIKEAEDILKKHFTPEAVNTITSLHREFASNLSESNTEEMIQVLKSFNDTLWDILQTRKKLPLRFEHKGADYTLDLMAEIVDFYKMLCKNIVDSEEPLESSFLLTITSVSLARIHDIHATFDPLKTRIDVVARRQKLDEINTSKSRVRKKIRSSIRSEHRDQ